MGDIEPVGKWKSISLDYDFIRSISADKCLYCLSAQQAQILLSIVELWRYKTRWYSEIGTALDTDWIEAAIDKISEELMVDHCDIDATLTAIENNITTINNNITTVNNNLTVLETNVTNITVQNNLTVINNFTANFTTYTTNNTDTGLTAIYARYNAFCEGIIDWIKSECYIVLANIGASPTMLQAVYSIIAGGLGPIAGLLFHGNPGAYTPTQIYTALTSLPDQYAVACYMVTYLANLPVTQANFQTALAGFTPANSNQTVIWVTLQAALLYGDAFAAFASNMQNEFQLALATNPTDFYCVACTPPSFCAFPQTWDFRIPQLLPWVINRGTLTVGQGIIGIPQNEAAYTFDVSIYYPTPCTTIIGRAFKFLERHLPATAGSVNNLTFWYLLAGVPTVYNTQSLSNNTLAWPAYNATLSFFTIPAPPGGAGVYRIRLRGNTPIYGNTVNLTAHDLAEIQII